LSRKSGTQVRDEWVGEPRHRCAECLRYYDPAQSMKQMANYTEDAFVLKTVIRPLAKAHGERLWEHVCGDCIVRLAQKERESVEWKPDQFGHYILSPDEERYGRMEERTGSIMASRGSNQNEAATASAPTETATPEQKGPTAAEKGAEDLKAKVEELGTQFPAGTKVKVTAKGSEFVGNYGSVESAIEKRGTPYVNVNVSHYASGKERPTTKLFAMRAASIEKVDAFPEYTAPAPAAPAAEAPAES